MANKVFTDESLSTLISQIKTYTNNAVAGKANATHTHTTADITSGTLATDRLPTVPLAKGGTGATTAAAALTNLGVTATAAELNKLDGVTATTTELNYVDGVTSNIQTQLNNKQNKLVSGTNIKSINGTSILGSGNINITTDLSNYYTKEATDLKCEDASATAIQHIESTLETSYYTMPQTNALLNEIETDKQDKLVSGTNIKTINGTSILGSGDVSISGGGGECNATQDFFVDYHGMHSIALDGTLTWLNIEDLDNASDSSFMEYCRTNIFQMGGVRSYDNYPDSQNPGRQGARGRFLFGNLTDGDGSIVLLNYLVAAAQFNVIDSMIVECIGGPTTSGAECTMIADIYTVSRQQYHLQICCKNGNYYTNGWELARYGGSGNYAFVDTDNIFVGWNKFESLVALCGKVADFGGEYGQEGQILSSTGDAVKWIDAPSGSSSSSGLTLFSTWTGNINAGGFAMSQNCVDGNLYLIQLGYNHPDDSDTLVFFGQGIFRASGEPGKYSWARIEFYIDDSATPFETLYATWCPSLGGPAAIYITGYSKFSPSDAIMCNLYKLN